MNIQSLSICVPAKKCINDCKFCCSKMHTADYEDNFTSLSTYNEYISDMKKRMEYARENGCNTCMLTGNNEPQQNREFLKVFALVNKSLKHPFLNIEIQTSGAFIDDEILDFLKESVGVTTIAISIACLDYVKGNREMIQTKDNNLDIETLCKNIKKRKMNLRLCLNMNDNMLQCIDFTIANIVKICTALQADQLTFRALWSPDTTTEQGKWIAENVTNKTTDLIIELKKDIKATGIYLDTLEYGYDRYDYHNMSVVIDEDSMSKEKKEAMKYLILRPNGKLYSKWDNSASLIF